MLNYDSSDVEIRKTIASSDETSAEVLEQLSQDAEAEVRRAVAKNPNTPENILLRLGKEFSDDVVANPIFSIILLEKPESNFFRLSLARSSTLSEELMAKLAVDPDEKIRCAIARNPNTSISLLEKLVEESFNRIFKDDEYEDYDFYPGEDIRAHVSENPKTPPALLEKLMQDESSRVRLAVAQNPNAPASILARLAESRMVELRHAVVRNSHTPASVLEYLAGDSEKDIRRSVKQHSNVSDAALLILGVLDDRSGTPSDVLEKLASDPRSHVRIKVAEHPKTPQHILEQLIDDADIEVCRAMTDNSNASSRILEKLAYYFNEEAKKTNQIWGYSKLLKHQNTTFRIIEILANFDRDVRYVLAKHNLTPPSTLVRLVEEDPNGIGSIVLDNPNAPSEALAKLIHEMNVSESIIRHPNITTELLTSLASHQSECVRKLVANHAKAPIPILEQLSEDSQIEVKACVASNSNTPVQILEWLAKNLSDTVQHHLAKNINTPVPLLIEMASNTEEDIRDGVAMNPSTPVHILERLVKNVSDTAQYHLAKNINTPVAILEELACSKSLGVRQTIAMNPNTPLPLLIDMANSKKQTIRQGVAKNPSTPIYILEKLAKDPEQEVRSWLAINPLVPSYILEMLVEDEEYYFPPDAITRCNVSREFLEKLAGLRYKTNYSPYSYREEILKRDDLSESLLEKVVEVSLAQLETEIVKSDVNKWFPENRVLEAVAAHPITPFHIIERIANSSGIGILGFVMLAENLKTPADLLVEIANHQPNASKMYDVSKVRELLANNPNTPTHVLEMLAEDQNQRVSEAARKALRDR